MKNTCILLPITCILLLTACPTTSNDLTNRNIDQNTPQEKLVTLFPVNIGAKWLYDKTTTNTITSVSVPGEKHEYIYVELVDFNSSSNVYNISIKEYIKRTKYYGGPGGMSDLVTYENIEKSTLLRNNNNDLECSIDNGTTWIVLYSTKPTESFKFGSFMVTMHDMYVQSKENIDYVDSIPTNTLGQFNGMKSYGFLKSYDGYDQKTNWEFYTKDAGLVEGYYQRYNFDPGFAPYIPSRIDSTTEHAKLIGYKIGNDNKGEDVSIIKYTEVFEY